MGKPRYTCDKTRCQTHGGKPCLLCTHPDLAQEWDTEQNTRTPSTLSRGSHARVHWICSEGHRWSTKLYSRTVEGSGCPICLGVAGNVTPDKSLAALYPNLVQEWDTGRNNRLPSEVPPRARYKAHWICSQGHRWVAQVSDRSRGRGCPACAGHWKHALPGLIRHLLPHLREYRRVA